MKRKVFLALAAMVLCGSFASCDKDDDEVIPSSDDKGVAYYDYSEKGFFMDGDFKIRGFFDGDSIMQGYVKYVKHTACYRTADGEECEHLFGYSLVVFIDKFARLYSDDIVYRADSTAIACDGQMELLADNANSYNVRITATIDSKGKPHLVTCYTTIDGKQLAIQFRERYFKSEYDHGELPEEDEFSI